MQNSSPSHWVSRSHSSSASVGSPGMLGSVVCGGSVPGGGVTGGVVTGGVVTGGVVTGGVVTGGVVTGAGAAEPAIAAGGVTPKPGWPDCPVGSGVELLQAPSRPSTMTAVAPPRSAGGMPPIDPIALRITPTSTFHPTDSTQSRTYTARALRERQVL